MGAPVRLQALMPTVAVGTRISPRPPHRSRRALLTHRAPPSGQTSCDERFSHVRRPTRPSVPMIMRHLSPKSLASGRRTEITWLCQSET